MTKDVLKGRSIVRKNVESNTNDLKEDLLKLSIKEFEEPPAEISLTDLSNEFHKNLDKGLPLLESFGLKPARFFEWFKLGFTDKSIEEKLSIRQKEYLTTLGLFDLEGKYIFDNCLVVPVFNENDEVTGFIGIDKDINVKKIGSTKGLLNHKALKVFDEIIITEKVLSALSLMETGFDNVVSVEGAENIAGEIFRQMKDNRVKTVVIAFEKQAESDLLKEILLLEDFKIKQIFPPMLNSWSHAIRNGIDKRFIKNLIDETKTFPEVNTSTGLTVKKDGSTYIFTINDITYRLFDVKEIFVTNLKVSIKASYGDEIFPDKVDLYSSRSRNSYSLTLSKAFNVEPKRIEKDLISIIEYLEKERDKRLGQTTGIDERPELTDEERKIGLDFLKSENLFEQIIKDMEILGCVGEENNKLLVWLSGNSRLLPKQLSNFIQSPPSVGKSYILETYLRIMPPEVVEWITSTSDQGFIYMSDDNFIGKIFMMGEALHNETVEGYIRQMQSENRLSRNVVQKDQKTGEMKTVKKIHSVQLVFMMTSTAMSVNRENLSRCILQKMDDSREQTERILAMQRHKASYEGYLEEKHLVPKIIAKHLAAQRILQKIKIFNPFEKYIKFPSHRSIARRGQPQFLGLIDCSCVSRQMQKTPVEKLDHYTREKEIVYECDLIDYQIARKLFIEGGLLQQDDDLSSGVVNLYESIRKFVKEKAMKENLKPEDVSFIQTDARDISQLSAIAIRKYIQILVDYEYLQVIGGRRHGTRFSYKLREDKLISEIDISSIIPTVEQIKKMMEGN